jgi:hypothetical protein
VSDFPSDEWICAGGEIDRVSVSLRVAGEDLNPEFVSQLLGVTPTFAARKGERRKSGERDLVQRTGVWFLELPESSEWELADALTELLARLPGPGAVWDALAERYTLDMFCGVFLNSWNRGFALPPTLLQALGERHLEFGVDIYCNHEPDV